MRAHKKIVSLCLALMVALCWSGLALAADAKKMDQTEMKTQAPASTAAKPAPKAAKVKAPAKQVNINTASAKDLEQLAGVGPKLAKSIVDYRKKNGKFKKPEDLMKVKGMGQKTYAMNKAYIKVN